MAIINWFHVILVAPMLTYIAYENSEKRPLNERDLTILGVVIVLMFFFHLLKGFYDVFKEDEKSE